MGISMEETIAAWRFCAMLLAEPVADSLAVLREQSVVTPDWLDIALKELDVTALDAWQGEHTRLFTFPAECPPFATPWLEEGVLDGYRAHELADVYQRLGLMHEGLPADYLGTISECLAWLYQHAEPDVIREFTHEFLDDWLGRFIDTLREKSELRLYKGLADLLETQWRLAALYELDA